MPRPERNLAFGVAHEPCAWEPRRQLFHCAGLGKWVSYTIHGHLRTGNSSKMAALDMVVLTTVTLSATLRYTSLSESTLCP